MNETEDDIKESKHKRIVKKSSSIHSKLKDHNEYDNMHSHLHGIGVERRGGACSYGNKPTNNSFLITSYENTDHFEFDSLKYMYFLVAPAR